MHSAPVIKDLVLIGGGHAHVHTLRSFAMNPIPGVRLTLIARDIDTPYSGMLPGFIAGHYTHEQCHIDLQPLARYARARLIHAAATNIDCKARRVSLGNRPDIGYDVLSIDIGSTPDLASVPGAAEYATPLKPVDGLARRWLRVLDDFKANPRPMHVVTVGGGAAGAEIALGIRHHLRGVLVASGLDPDMLQFTLVTRGDILAGHNSGVRHKMRQALAERGVTLLEQTNVERVDADRIHTANGRAIAYDQLIWGTDARGASWLADTGLSLDAHGFIKIDGCLRAVGQSVVFAAGDVASSVPYPRPKAGVFAVRQGPPLTDNLRRVLTGSEPRPFKPQREFLSLVSLGDKSAIASRSWWSLMGPWVWKLKDRIDRDWMAKAKAVPDLVDMAAAGHVAVPQMPADDPLDALKVAPMRCGGCGAKVGASQLDRVLDRLSATRRAGTPGSREIRDDAAIIELPAGLQLVQSVDFFRAFIDDPYIFGRVAANHALGDIYAMGGTPLSALAIATVPHADDDKVEDDLYMLLRGGQDVLQEAGAALVGGHSAEGAELALGFSVNGAVDARRILRKGGSQAGDTLILTKPLGTGALFAADMRARARGLWISEALTVMQQSNARAAEILAANGATAATDVTGFGVLGHLVEMLRASGVDANLVLDRLPALAGAREVLAAGFASSLAPDNLRLRRVITNLAAAARQPSFTLLFDPQTAGGLLATVPAAQAEQCLAQLRAAGYPAAAPLGHIVRRAGNDAAVTIADADQAS